MDGYKVTVSPEVSTDVLGQHAITLIAGGQRSEVSVVRTHTGTYSTDALTSPHVKYHGIEVERVPTELNVLMSWVPLVGWVKLDGTSGDSVLRINSGPMTLLSTGSSKAVCGHVSDVTFCS